ncbi:MAG: glycosyltransferase family 2 protein [Candidatus Nanopelagicales bacterium]
MSSNVPPAGSGDPAGSSARRRHAASQDASAPAAAASAADAGHHDDELDAILERDADRAAESGSDGAAVPPAAPDVVAETGPRTVEVEADAEAPAPETSPEPEAVPVEEPVDERPDADSFAALLDELDDPDDDVPPRDHHVTAVLVAHDGARWLPAVLTALARSARRPDRLVAVDTGSLDETPDLLARAQQAGLVDRVLTVARDTGFGAAVAAGLATGSGTGRAVGDDVLRWVWLLHDDSAPAPTALEQLLRTSDRMPSADVLGPKLRGWRHPDFLVQAGVTVARSGNLVTGLERHELDQGQHDATTDVLAVDSAGMLVRREVWDALGGFDPALPLFRDDIDFCWRARRAGHRVVVATSAVVHHREAATHGRRPVDAGSPKHPDRPHRLDRVAAIHVARAHATGVRGLFASLRMLVGSLLRALGLLLGKAPEAARDEWGAFRDAVRDRRGLSASRARVRSAAEQPGAVPEREVRHFLAPRSLGVRHAIDKAGEVLAGDSGDAERSVLDSTSDDPDGWYADDRRPSRLRRILVRPATLLLLGLVLLSLVAERALLGSGYLQGGALLPAPDGVGELWGSYLTAWHEVGPGSAADAPAWLAPLSLLALLLRGSASAANDVVLLALVPLAGLTSYLALRGVVRTPVVRIWAAVTYATLPAATGAISGGRLGTAVAMVLLPWLARSCARLAGVGGPSTWRRVAGTSLLLAVVAAFVPVVWLVAAVLAVIAAVTVVRDGRGRLRLLVSVLAPVAMLVPWSLRVVREPALLWLEPGLVGPTDLRLTSYDVVLMRPGGVGSTPLWLAAGLILGGLAALVVGSRKGVALAAWVVGLVALAFGLVQQVIRVTPPALGEPVAPWPGTATAIWGGALIVCSAVLVEQLPRRLEGASFGWRQPAAALLSVLLLLAPIGALAIYVLGVDGPLRRGDRDVLPAFVAAQMATPERPRAVVLERSLGDRVVYDLLAAPIPQTGDIDVAPPAAVTDQLDRVIARVVAGLGADEVDQLATHGIRYLVLADAGRRDPLVATLDGQRGLRHLSSRDGAAVWEVVPVSSRVQVIEPPAGDSAGTVQVRRSTPVPLDDPDPRSVPTVDATVAAGVSGRTLVMSETRDSRWRWTADGADVTPVAGGVDSDDPALQVAGVPATVFPATIAFDGSSRTGWLWAQAAVVLLVVLLALPSRRTEDDEADADSDIADSDVSGEPAPVAARATTEPETPAESDADPDAEPVVEEVAP